SLLIVTMDEGHNGSPNRIATIFAGATAQVGEYAGHINHYTVLRTLEAMFGLAPLDLATNEATILNAWTTQDSPPQIQLASPTAGKIFTLPATITLNANVEAQEGNITKVEFFAGNT